MSEAEEPRSVIQPTRAEAVALARRLLAEARQGALAVLDPATGWPLVSRVGLALDGDGVPLILISALAAHTGALRADPRCSLLVGEAGKGDPLAHPRATIRARAEELGHAGPRVAAAAQYLAQQPKARLYAELPHFSYFRLVPVDVALNGGFGRAFRFAGALLIG